MWPPLWPDRETRETGPVLGQPRSWPGFPRGQLLYPARSRPCPRMRWPRPRPAPHPTWGALSPGPAFPPPPPAPRTLDLAPWAGPGFAGCPDSLPGASGRMGLVDEAPALEMVSQGEGAPGPGRPCRSLRFYRPSPGVTSCKFPPLPNLTGCTRLLGAGHPATPHPPPASPWLASRSWGREWAAELPLP